MAKPPNWTRDKLILALNLFFSVNPIHTTEEHPEIIKLGRVLNDLPIQHKQDIGVQFRNPNWVYMKICNYLKSDPD
jgi:5-methylcytosine-specific restriction enzyme A